MTAIPANAEPTAIVTADALFESALATVLILGAAGGAFGGGDFPAPVGGPLLVGVGCALLPVAAYLWRIAQHSVRAATLRMLGIANGVTALAVFGWLLLAPGFSAAG